VTGQKQIHSEVPVMASRMLLYLEITANERRYFDIIETIKGYL